MFDLEVDGVCADLEGDHTVLGLGDAGGDVSWAMEDTGAEGALVVGVGDECDKAMFRSWWYRFGN